MLYHRRLSGFLLYAAHLVTVWGLALSNAVLGLTVLGSLWQRPAAPRWSEIRHLAVPLASYAAFLVVSVVYSVRPAESLRGLSELFSLFTLALGPFLVRGTRDVRLVFDLLTGTIALLAVHGIWQYAFTDYGDLHNRIVGPFSHYQTFAGILLLGSLMLFARIVTMRMRIWHWLAFAAVNGALILTLTRGAWVAAAGTLAVFGLVRARRHLAVGLAVTVAAAWFLAPQVPAEWQERARSIYDLGDASNYDRICMMEAGLAMVSEHPFFGLGPGMVEQLYPLYRNPSAPRREVPHLHNALLDLAAERGLLTLAAYVWLVGACLWLTLRAYRREGGLRGDRADLHLGVLLALFGFHLAGLFENNWGDTEVQRLALFLMAVPYSLCSPGERSNEAAIPTIAQIDA